MPGRPLADYCYGEILANGARHNDEGNVQTQVLEQLQCPRGLQLRHPIVRQNHMGWRLQVIQIFGLCFQSDAGWIEPASAQLVHHQLGVLRTILQNQDADGNRDSVGAISSSELAGTVFGELTVYGLIEHVSSSSAAGGGPASAKTK